MKLLFVCLGNICRSPTLEIVARERFAHAGVDWQVASCGTGDWHVGEGADARSVRIAGVRGYALEAHRARTLAASDFADFDLLLAADAANLAELRRRAPTAAQGRLALALSYAGLPAPHDVPDPYYGGERDFHRVVDLAEQIADGLLRHLRSRHTAPVERLGPQPGDER
jgi:protein-tyrosine phosphatase